MSNKSMMYLSIVGEHLHGNTSPLLPWLSIKMNGKLENDSLPPGEYQVLANGNYRLGNSKYYLFVRQEDGGDHYGLSVRLHRPTNGWIMEFDLTKLTSLESLEEYYDTTEARMDAIMDVGPRENVWDLILVGTKADLAPNDRLPKSTIEEFAKSKAMPYFEITTDASATIQEAFDTIIGAVDKRRAARMREQKDARRKKARCVVM